ncbi:MAG: cytidine deaminase [Oscillospiraceae bacterium]|jgi:cytidine deaminase|nr:cytidine deaminase [Oscillospiraceae bacterium]
MRDTDLLEAARAALEHSYSPYSHLPVGAAIECADGTVFTGANIENAAFPSTICAEAAALSAAVSAGKREFRRIAIVADAPNYPYPCGNCRQLLAEFSPNIEVLARRGNGSYVSFPLSDLFPERFAFRLD